MKKIKLFVTSFVFLFISCFSRSDHEGTFRGNIYIKNISNESVFITSYGVEKNEVWSDYKNYHLRSIPKGEKIKYVMFGHDDKYENYKSIFLIFKNSTVEKYGWDSIKKNNIYDKKYESFKYLKSDTLFVYDGS